MDTGCRQDCRISSIPQMLLCCEWINKMKGSPDGIRSERERRQRWRQRPSVSVEKCESVFQRNQSKTGHGEREWQRQNSPGGLENMPRPEPTWAKIGDKCAPVLLIFYPSASFPFVCLSQALISVQSTSLFLSVAHSFLFVALLFFSSLFLCLLFLPHQYLITLILFMKQTNTCLHIVFLCVPLFFSSSISSVSFISVSPLIHLVEGSKQNLWHGLSRAKYSWIQEIDS